MVKSSKPKYFLSEINFDPSLDIEMAVKNNLQSLIDEQIRLDDKLVVK